MFAGFCASMTSNSSTMSISDLKRRRHEIGVQWEKFCASYLLTCEGYVSVSRLCDVDEADLKACGLKRKDMGIDMIATNRSGERCAIQCKYRSKGAVSWRELSTFYALCARTGPWSAEIVMTNQSRVAHEGTRRSIDRTMTRRDFESIPRHLWQALAGIDDNGRTVGGLANDRSAWLTRIEHQRDAL